MTKAVMISQPMGGKTDREILETRERAILELQIRDYHYVIDTLFTKRFDEVTMLGVKSEPLLYLAKSLEAMSHCDAVYFVKGWEQARGCRIEHEAAKEYGLEIIYEK